MLNFTKKETIRNLTELWPNVVVAIDDQLIRKVDCTRNKTPFKRFEVKHDAYLGDVSIV